MKRIILLLVVFLGLGLYQLHSQTYLDLIQNPNENTTLQEIQHHAEIYFEGRDKGRGSGYKQYKRWEYQMERMVNADGRLQNFSKLNWELINELNSESSPINRSSGPWTSLGPTNYTNGTSGYNGGLGRVNVIAFHPTNANIIYIGVPAGGVWKTTDGGTTWTPISDVLASIGISGIVVDHSSPNTVYILTGDGDGSHTQSIGVMKSIDGGTTWTTTGLSWGASSFNRGYKLLMHPTNSNTMFAATTVGILKTTNGWNTWTMVQSGSFRDIEFKPGSPATMYATTVNSFYRSTNTGSSWSLITSGLPFNEDRSEIGVSPANNSYVYYVAGPAGTNSYKGLYRSTDSGLTFSTMSTTPNILGYSSTGMDSASQSYYDLAIAVNPTNANNTIIGGINIWRSTNGGGANTCITSWFEPPGAFQYVHADIHELVYNPLNNNLYCGSDGGFSVSTDNGQTWTNLWNGLDIMQFYRIDGVEANQNLLLGGTQDNGSNKYTGSTTILHILGADGMDCLIDYNNNNNLYYSIQNGGLQRSTNGGATSTGIQPGGSVGSWVTPYAMDATNPSIIYGGYNDVYRSTNMGNNWTNLGSDGRGALAVGVNNPARIYAANNNILQTSANTGGSWTTITGPWPALTITFVAVDPANANRVWVTLGGYTSGQKVYESTNAGASWTNISAGLPNSPALSIAYENTSGSPMDAIYVGMAVGVYYRSDVTPWTLHGTGLPNSPIYDLEINHTNSKIRVGTFGRGLWETSLFTTSSCDLQITNISTTPTSCPNLNDGAISITASCTTCTGIDYTLTPTAPPGAPITQTNNGVFINLAPNSYNITVVDTGDATCTDTWSGNPVTVNTTPDNTPPAISCPPDPNIECGDDTSPANTGTASSTDNCDPAPVITFTDSSVGNCGNTEVITRTWTSTDASGNFSNCVQTITVIDSTPPIASCPSNISVNNDSGLCEAVVNYTTPTGSDACGSVMVTQTGGLISGSAFPVGTTTNAFDVTDACGNIATCSFNVIVSDTEDPIIVCPTDQTVNPGSGNQYTVPDYFGTGAATVTDNCTSPVTLTTQNPTAGTMLNDGNYTVTLSADDQYGNSSSCTFMLTVDSTLGINNPDLIAASITLYPNPTSNLVVISNPLRLELESVSVFNLNGQLIKTIDLRNMEFEQSFDISYLAKGSYLLTIKGHQIEAVRHLLKN